MSAEPIQAKPLPVVAPWARPFWDAARENKLVLQHRNDCGKTIFYPRQSCPHCFSDKLGWQAATGRGTIYSYTVVKANAPSAFLADMPYVMAVIRLEEGVQMLANIVGCELAQLRCDMPVQMVFEKLNDELTLPKFRPATA